MQICSYRASGGSVRLGVLSGDTVTDLVAAYEAETGERLQLGSSVDPLRSLLESGSLDGVRAALDSRTGDGASSAVAAVGLDDVTLLAPITRPDKFICIGLNYAAHATEAGMDIPDVPTFFVKLPNAVIPHGAPIPIPRSSHRIDWEGELAFVIGKRCSQVPAADAMDVIAGFTVVNDVSARDYQFKTSQWIVGKTFDGFAPIGPALVTADEVGDPHDLRLTTRVSGELFQDSRTSDLIFGVPALIEFLSSIMTLEPGDVVATGTPSGIGAMQQPRRWLRDGDVVEIEVERVGRLVNPVAGPA